MAAERVLDSIESTDLVLYFAQPKNRRRTSIWNPLQADSDEEATFLQEQLERLLADGWQHQRDF